MEKVEKVEVPVGLAGTFLLGFVVGAVVAVVVVGLVLAIT